MKQTSLFLGFLLLGAANIAFAQGGIGAPFTTDGVTIDAEGVLRSRAKPDPRLSELQKEAARYRKYRKRLYISLPRIFAEAEKLQQEGKPLPDRIRYLGGMVKLQYIFVYPDKGDIVIAGRAEPFEKDQAYRPLGKFSGRPVLHLDDLVSALRALGPGKTSPLLGCDLEMTAEIVNRINLKAQELQPEVPRIGKARAAELISAAGGPQGVRYFGVDRKSRFAMVCIEADYQLKQLQLGILPSPSRRIKSYMSMATRPEKSHRTAFESKSGVLVNSLDGNAFEIRGPSLEINCTLFSVSRQTAAEGKISTAARRFRDQCNNSYESLCRGMLSFADVTNLSDLSILAALIGQERLDQKIDWDMDFVMKSYQRVEFTAPQSVQTVCNYRLYGQQIIFTSGGVGIMPSAVIKNRTEDDKGAIKHKAQRPEGDEWSLAEKYK